MRLGAGVSFSIGAVAGIALLALMLTLLPPKQSKEKETKTRNVQQSVACSELRVEFFSTCLQTMTRQQCEALYGQTRGRLFDGSPSHIFAKELDCSETEMW